MVEMPWMQQPWRCDGHQKNAFLPGRHIRRRLQLSYFTFVQLKFMQSAFL
jgi:hypothetical protein